MIFVYAIVSCPIFDINTKLFVIRYRNILPYNKNRVKIQNPVDGCDYINASWITDGTYSKNIPCSDIAFMSCQGPTQWTTPIHWQMIYENDIDIIVMLTRFKEKKNNGN